LIAPFFIFFFIIGIPFSPPPPPLKKTRHALSLQKDKIHPFTREVNMKKSLVWLAILCVAIFAQEPDPTPAPAVDSASVAVPEPEPVAPAAEPAPAVPPVPVAVDAPKPLSLAEALNSSSLPAGCKEDFTSVLGKEGFSMGSFIVDLPVEAAKVKIKMKAPFGKPKDSDKTSVGLTVGCINALPESPAEIGSLLSDIGRKAGLSMAAGGSGPTNIPNEGGSGGGKVAKIVISSLMMASGLGLGIYGITLNSDVKDNVSKGKGKDAMDAAASRDMFYGIGASLLGSGLIVLIAF
jgi:hypothetical protein